MARFEVTTSALETMAGDIDQQTSEFRNIMDEAQGCVQSLRGFWESEAHDTFESEFTKLYNNLSHFDTVLNGYSSFLREVAGIYESTDKKAMDDVNVLNSSSLFTQ